MPEKDAKPTPEPEAPKERNYTQELLAARARGERIVCSMAPYAGNPVDYDPRSKTDPQPWVLAGWGGRRDDWYRYTGRECHAVQD